MMRNAIEFEDREARVVAWVPCDLTSRDLEERATRLRSWALIVGATIAGPAFVTLRGAEGARLCLPLAEWYPAHPETGVTVQRDPATPIARVANASIVAARAMAEDTLAALGGCRAASGDPEFHPATKGSLEGELIIPLHPEAVRRPLAVAV
jgi:hypothetical protein